MLLGEYNARLDTKGRVVIPGKFRKSLGDQLIITKGYEKTLIIVSQKHWETLLEGTERKPFIQAEIREVHRFLLGSAFDGEIDKKGRLMVPMQLRNFAHIEDEIIFLGLSRYVEVWAKKRWEEHRGVLEENIGRISEKLVPWDLKEVTHE